jgi:sulfatase-like protein
VSADACTQGGRGPSARGSWPGGLVATGHLAALWSLAVAEPLFDLLGRNPEFFAARGEPRGDIVAFAVGLVLLPPLVLGLVVWLAGRLGERLRRAVLVALVALLAAPLALQVLKHLGLTSAAPLLAGAVLLAALAAAAYARVEPVRSLCTVLAGAPLVFVVLFLLVSPVHKLIFPPAVEAASRSVGAHHPIVWISFDEFPTTSLMQPGGRIDAARFPHFAALARQATWYRNATTVYDSTEHAQPLFLDGKLPQPGKLPTAADHPDNLFELLEHSYRENISEEATNICPPSVCAPRGGSFAQRMHALGNDLGLVYAHLALPASTAASLPSVSQSWGDFNDAADDPGPDVKANIDTGKRERLEAWMDRITPGSKPQLSWKHSLLPHVPWRYTPAGALYTRTVHEPILGLSGPTQDWGNRTLELEAQQRYLLQTEFVDREVGRLMRRLKATGLWDTSVVVITADHGNSFRTRNRRIAVPANLIDIAPVPVFIKAPGQRRGRTDDAFLRTVDVLPTVAALAGFTLPWKHDGRPATDPRVRDRRTVSLIKRDFSGHLTMSATDFERRRAAVLRRNAALFGTGRSSPGLFGVGPDRALIGRRVASLASAPAGATRAALNQAGDWAHVDPASGYVPALVTGRLTGPGADRPARIVIAVNGVIRAAAPTFHFPGTSGQSLAEMIPETSLRRGANRIAVYAVTGPTAAPRLAPLTATG